MNSEYYYFGLYENRYRPNKLTVLKHPNNKVDIFEDEFECLLLLKKICNVNDLNNTIDNSYDIYEIEKIIYSNLDDRDDISNCILKIKMINDNKIQYEFQNKQYNYVKRFILSVFCIDKNKINNIYNKRLNERIIETFNFMRHYKENKNYTELSNKINDIFDKNNLFMN